MAQRFRPDANIVIIRERGINAKGYGHVAKKVMTDPDISISAKGIYGYLSSMAGSGESSFTKRSRILTELNMGERAYDSNMKQLEEKGYIARAQSRTLNGYFGTTIIEFVMIPTHLAEEIAYAQEHEEKPTMYSGTVYALGYGSIPRLVMQDPTLSVKAKGLYAYFCSFAGPGEEAFPSRPQILLDLNINKNSYNDYRQELEKQNYITTYRKHCSGKLAGNHFRLNQFPTQVEEGNRLLVETSSKVPVPLSCVQVPKNSSTVTQIPKNSSTDNQVPKNECTANECTANECTANSSTHIINNNTQTINNPSTNNILLDRLIDIVREKIGYTLQKWIYGEDMLAWQALDILVDAIVGVLSSQSSRIQIGKEVYLTKHVQEELMKVNNELVVIVIDRYLARQQTVDNPSAYLLAAIYNEIACPTTTDEEALS